MVTMSINSELPDTSTHCRDTSPSALLLFPLPVMDPSPPGADRCACHCNPNFWDWRVERLQKHGWELVCGELLPIYAFQPVTRITEIWDEHAAGLNGYLAVRDLDERWQARWRRNVNTLRTENCQRKKVAALVKTLTRKPNWSVNLALQFLRDKYETHPDFKKPRTFCDYLQKGGGSSMKDVLIVAQNYP
ncbi:hypothetical protein K503DRAFT_867272 [Rhizopogon vinicolor AM-OR11-026]|uniref:Transcription activator GCR1-like domain-containing protein n=1 Tax=Rhizopogon vinicolor AM-OR11-026 TaxID=1314800 RepID=A0A1B7MW61_9AGAM|nr:hypothetical protein K503DRAFT_867272 [Rhizopogon vinicolor AM-OR11-026]